jgi:Mor family transcriptional regulator
MADIPYSYKEAVMLRPSVIQLEEQLPGIIVREFERGTKPVQIARDLQLTESYVYRLIRDWKKLHSTLITKTIKEMTNDV